MVPELLIEVYERKRALSSQRWRWRAKAANSRKLANGGEGYTSSTGLLHALHVLWPPGSDAHVMVQMPGKPPRPLAGL